MAAKLSIFGLLCLGFLYSSAQIFGPMPRDIRDRDRDQQERKGFDPERLFFGGNMGLMFGDFTFINLSPQVGYMFTDRLGAGGGINFISSTIKTRYLNGQEAYRENFGYAGLNVFGRFFPTNFLFASVQPELNYSWGRIVYRNPPAPTEKLGTAFVPSLLVGGGLVMGGSGRPGRGTLISIQYDALQDPRSPYGTRAFINFGVAL